VKEQADELLSARRADRFAEQRMQEVAICAAPKERQLNSNQIQPK